MSKKPKIRYREKSNFWPMMAAVLMLIVSTITAVVAVSCLHKYENTLRRAIGEQFTTYLEYFAGIIGYIAPISIYAVIAFYRQKKKDKEKKDEDKTSGSNMD